MGCQAARWRLKQLEAENARLKKLVAERDLEIEVSVPARRRQVAYSRERGLSARRTCTLFKVARSALSYQGRKAVKDAPMVERMRELSAQYPRYGYRRIRIFLGREGYRVSPGRAHRLWRLPGCNCRASARRSGSPLLGRDRKRSAGRTRYGPTTSCSIIVSMVSNSVPDRHRGVHQRRMSHRRRQPHPLCTRHRGAVPRRQHTRRSTKNHVTAAGPS